MMMPVKEIVPGLAEAITDRRRALRMNVQALVDESGITRQGLAPILRGERRAYQDRVRFGVCRALRWTSDSVDALLDGRQPTTLEEALDGVENQIDYLTMTGGGERGELRDLMKVADSLRIDLGLTAIYTNRPDSHNDVKGLLTDHDRAVLAASQQPDDVRTDELSERVAEMAERIAELAAGLATMGAEVARLRDQKRRGESE